ncbi:MAG: SDR family oxidoreductase [Flavobacteriaceae bacterium]
MSRVLFLGFGYVAGEMAPALAGRGWRFAGTSRDEARRQAIAALGGEAIDPGDAAALARAAGEATHLVVSAAPSGGDPFLTAHGDLLRRNSGRLEWIGYLSATSVYGVTDGRWVDEESETVPLGRRGADRLAAERAWSAFGEETGVACVRFRLAGIYGPGRNALEQIRAGTARRIVKPGQVFNRIHVADIIHVVAASMAMPGAGSVFNVADDCPAPPQDVIAYAAALLGVPAPPEEPFSTASLTPMSASFYAENKRMRNARIKTRLGVRLAYPEYRAGLDALHADA